MNGPRRGAGRRWQVFVLAGVLLALLAGECADLLAFAGSPER